MRLHRGLLDFGVDSHFLALDIANPYKACKTTYKGLFGKLISKLRPFIDTLPLRLFYPRRERIIFSNSYLNNAPLIRTINALKPDVVHIHWVQNGFLSLKDISKIKAKILFTLHDSYAFTGGCHYGCDAFKTGCKCCPTLKSHTRFDLSALNSHRKGKLYNLLAARDNLNINGLSRWIYNNARNSALLKNAKFYNLPNTINTSIFKPLDKSLCKDLLNLPKDRKIIGFGAFGATEDKRKGYDLLVEALKSLASSGTKNLELLVFGAGYGENIEGIKTHYLGILKDELSLNITYNALDCFIVPSRSENLSNAIMEALSCNVGVVGFDIGGNKDMIEHKVNGYLAKPYDTNDLANGILETLSLSGNGARKSILEKFDQKIIIPKYIDLYNSL